MSLFSGLEVFGLKTADMEVYPKEEIKDIEETEKSQKKTETPVKEEDCLFLKSHKCPVCDYEFKALAVRTGKIRTIGQDDDLRPLYRNMDPLKYDPIVCPKCGYAAMNRYFDTIMPLQRKKIKQEIQPNFKGMQFSEEKYSYEEAIMRYKMVLMNDVVGNVKKSRKAYTCLKFAWVIRGKLETESVNMDAEEIEKMQNDELECLANAFDGYMDAFSSERFPMSGMDENTILYLNAEIAFRLGKHREALQLLSVMLGKKDIAARIKNKVLDLKERIREQVKEKNN